MPVEESCGAIVWKFEKGVPRFLVLRRADEENVWEPPKGHRNPDESEREAAVRELREEVGIDNAVFDPAFRTVLEYTNSKGVTLRYVFFLVRANSVKLSAEHNDAKWISLEELPIYFKYDDIRSVYRKAAENTSRVHIGTTQIPRFGHS